MNGEIILGLLKKWGVSVLLFVLLVGAGVFGYLKITDLNENIASLSGRITSLEGALDTTVAYLEGSLEEKYSSLTDALNQERQKASQIEQKLGGFEKEVGTISDTVTTLDKLSKTDPELLQKYSKVFFLNEHYAPERVTEIPLEYRYSDQRAERIHALVWQHLKALLDGAKRDGKELYVKSAYRPFDEQVKLKSSYTVIYGVGTANQFSADQGYSEHQLGTTVDFITTGLNGQLYGFENTDEYQWLLDNAHIYGFTLSYPENNSYYVFEPWHWRYVGDALATDLRNQGKHFYDLDQREIDTYLVKLFD